jgi:hypothetical protein
MTPKTFTIVSDEETTWARTVFTAEYERQRKAGADMFEAVEAGLLRLHRTLVRNALDTDKTQVSTAFCQTDFLASSTPLNMPLAVVEAIRYGNTGPLLEYLRSDLSLSGEDRELLADYIEGKWKRGRGRPRERNQTMIMIAGGEAKRLKKQLKAEGRWRGVEETAIQQACADLKDHGFPVPDEESVRYFVKRSSRIRKSRP